MSEQSNRHCRCGRASLPDRRQCRQCKARTAELSRWRKKMLHQHDHAAHLAAIANRVRSETQQEAGT